MSFKYELRKGFLNVDDKEEKYVLPLRVEGSVEQCLRCGKPGIVSKIGSILEHFVCDSCRTDENEWDFVKRAGGISYTVKAMVNEMPDKYFTDTQNGEGRS